MPKYIHILLVDDDKYFRLAVKNILSGIAIVTEASTEAQALDFIDNNLFDMALIDMDIDKQESGLAVLRKTKEKNIHSIILSSQKDESIIENAYIYGCKHFLAKSQYKDHLLTYIHKYKEQTLKQSTAGFFQKEYITKDQELINTIEDLCKMNLTNKTILITGETGVGKSLIGKLIHKQNFIKESPFIHINCSEISENLIESELFGHKKGSFTGANQDKKGKLELANGGTLFLDEVGTMPISMQQKLLKAIDEKSFFPIGSEKEITSNFTLITATCEDLLDKINANEFRKDLYFRLAGINLHLKSLKQRSLDIPLLINHFLNQSTRKIILKEDAKAKLVEHSWPGNTRELKKMIEYLTSIGKGIITAKEIKFNYIDRELKSESVLTLEQKKHIRDYGLRSLIKDIEEQIVAETLKENKGKITHTMKELKISSSAFYRIFDQLKA